MKKKLAIFGILIAIIATIAYGSDIVQSMRWNSSLNSMAVSTKGDGTKFLTGIAEGTCTPSDSGLGNMTGSGTYVGCKWKRVGNVVFFEFESLSGYTTTAASTATYLHINTTGLPSVTTIYPHGGCIVSTAGRNMFVGFDDTSGGDTRISLLWYSLTTGATAMYDCGGWYLYK